MLIPTRLTAALAGALLVPLAAQANEYSLQYGAEAKYEYNDNVGLRTDQEIDVSGGQLVLPATLTSRSERLDASLAGKLTFAQYNESDWNSDDQDLQARAKYQLERGEVQGNAGFRRNSTRETEFLDTGVLGLSATRVETATVGGSGFHMFTEKNGITGGASYADVSYDSPRYRDYDYLTGYGGWIHQWDERLQLRLQGYGSRYENDGDIQVESDGLGAQTGFEYALSEKLSVDLLAGWLWVDTSYNSSLPANLDDDDSDGLMMEGSIKYREERYELEARAKSQPSPSGDGYMLDTRQLDLTWRYHLSERSRLDVGATLGTTEALDNRINNDRDYARGRLRLDYRFSPAWYIAGSYVYSYQDRDRLSGDADANAVYLSLIFKPEKSVWSR